MARVWIDPRVGSSPSRSREDRLESILQNLHLLGVPAQVKKLEFGDVAFPGLGPRETVSVGIELKTVKGLLSDIVTGRFAGSQVAGMQRIYQYRYLFVEGAVRAGRDGLLEVPAGEGRWLPASPRMMYVDYLKFIQDVELRGGFHYRRTWSKIDTLSHVAAEYHGWQKPWDKHKALKAFNEAGDPSGVIHMHPPTLLRLWARDLPGIGWERSEAVERVFANPLAMAKATEAEWRGISGIGKVIASRVWGAIRGLE